MGGLNPSAHWLNQKLRIMNVGAEEIEERIKQKVLLKDYTTFKIGGSAQYFLEVSRKEELLAGIEWAKNKKAPFFVLGGGSNLLVSDKGFAGLVIKVSLNNCQFNGEKALAQAGVNLARLAKECCDKGLSGLEWSSGIQKITVGGAIYGNAGAFGTNCADLIESVQALDTLDGAVKTFSFNDCQFDYKDSVFKKNKSLIILTATFCLESKDSAEIEREMKRILAYRNQNHPKESSAGSVFKNPFQAPSAGELIEKCGLKGRQIGQAMISQKHANFIVNLGQAKASDVLALINLAKQKVKEQFNIVLQEEIQYLNL